MTLITVFKIQKLVPKHNHRADTGTSFEIIIKTYYIIYYLTHKTVKIRACITDD